MCGVPVGRMLVAPPIRPNQEDSVPLIQVKLIRQGARARRVAVS
jgi:hypothetical protein